MCRAGGRGKNWLKKEEGEENGATTPPHPTTAVVQLHNCGKLMVMATAISRVRPSVRLLLYSPLHLIWNGGINIRNSCGWSLAGDRTRQDAMEATRGGRGHFNSSLTQRSFPPSQSSSSSWWCTDRHSSLYTLSDGRTDGPAALSNEQQQSARRVP